MERLGRLLSGTSAYEDENFGEIGQSFSREHSGQTLRGYSGDSIAQKYGLPRQTSTDDMFLRQTSAASDLQRQNSSDSATDFKMLQRETSTFSRDGGLEYQHSTFFNTTFEHPYNGKPTEDHDGEADDSTVVNARRSTRAQKRSRTSDEGRQKESSTTLRNLPRGAKEHARERLEYSRKSKIPKSEGFVASTSESMTGEITARPQSDRVSANQAIPRRSSNNAGKTATVKQTDTEMVFDVSKIPDKIFREYCPNESGQGLCSQPLELRLFLSSKAASELRPNALRSQVEVSLVQWGTHKPLIYLDDDGEIRQAEPCIKKLELEKKGNQKSLKLLIQRKGAANDHSKSLPLSKSHGGFPFHFVFTITPTKEVVWSNPVEILSKETSRQKEEKSVVKLLESKGKLRSST